MTSKPAGPNEHSTIVAWLQNQSWWISPVAAITAIITFVLTQMNPGRLELFLPDEAGVVINNDRTVSMILPVTIANTSAARRRRVVNRITGTLINENSGSGSATNHQVRWTRDFVFMGKDQYFTKYPKKATSEDTTFSDYFDYNQRAVPFAIQGGTSVSRVLGLQADGPSTVTAVNTVVLTLVISSADGERYVASARYDCHGHAVSGRTHWCRRYDEGESR